MLCNFVRACIGVCTVHTSRRLAGGFFSKEAKPVLTPRENSPVVRAGRMPRIPIDRLPMGLVTC